MDYYYTKKGNHNAAEKRKTPLLKVCGMQQNIEAVALLQPDYMGFIFWKPSKRFFHGAIAQIPHGVKKVGVFVDAPIPEIKEITTKYKLLYAQLHGNESPAYCDELKKQVPELQRIKVFSIDDAFDFTILRHFEDVCEYYLFDTKGKLPGGNGFSFNWDILKKYPSTKPYFLSGGIGIQQFESLKSFFASPASQHCMAIDVNSKFEVKPGLKDIQQLKKFKKLLKNDL